jgi:signal transduction histidine kinase
MTRPIERLVAATKEVAKGNLSIEVPVTGSDERAQLTRAFNTMIRELAEMHRQIARRERMTVVGEVASELIHDLRHPIRNIENAASLLTSRGHDEEVREMFERVTKREFTGLNRFLENLEQLVAEPVIQTADVDVVQEVKALVESTRTSPTASQLQWVVQSTNGAAVARADRFALQRVLQNLVTNAVEAASPSGSVEIEIDAAEDIGIRIANTGALIPEERLAMLFDMLKTTKRRGIGLGLAICKKLVTAMGGTIQASNRESGGVVFSVRLPKASAQDQEAA